MFVTRLTIPTGLQTNSFNCQSLWDKIRSCDGMPKRKRIDGQALIAEWDSNEEGDAEEILMAIEDTLVSSGIELDEEEPSYPGVSVRVIEDDRMEEATGEVDFDDDDEDDDD